MLVAISSFGSIWRARSRQTQQGSQLKLETAYYNTTGIHVRDRIRQRPKISGYARFNGDSGFDPNYPSRAIERVFECDPPCVWKGDNKLLFKKMLSAPIRPEMFIIVISSDVHGDLRIGTRI
jgi:hypothetical protein